MAAIVDLKPAEVKIVGFYRSDTFNRTITFTPPGSFDFTGAVGNCQILNKSTNALVEELTTANGGLTFPTSDNILLFVSDADTATWPVCALVGDIQVEFSDGTIRTLVKLEIIVEKPITPV